MLLNEVLQSGLKIHKGKKQDRPNRESVFELHQRRVAWASVDRHSRQRMRGHRNNGLKEGKVGI